MPKTATKVQPPSPKTISPLKRVRVLAGLKQRAVAAAVGRLPGWLCRAERGNVTVSVDDALRLSKVLKTPVEVLFPAQGGRR